MEPEADFVCIESSSVSNDTRVLDNTHLIKSKKLFNIRSNGKRLWIKHRNTCIKYGFTKNQYKSDAKDGTIVIILNNEGQHVISSIDDIVQQRFISMYTNTILNNMMLTENVIKSMFKQSLYNNTLKVTLSPDTCKLFDEKKIRIDNINFTDDYGLTAGEEISIIFEPSFAWMMNKKIGIRWDVRQIQLHKKQTENEIQQTIEIEEPSKGWKLSNDNDDENREDTITNANVNVNVNVNANANANANVKNQNNGVTDPSKGWMLTNDSDDDNDNVINPTTQPVKRKVKIAPCKPQTLVDIETTKTWMLTNDSEDEE